MLERIEEEQEATIVQERPEIQLELPIPETNVTYELPNVSEPPRVSAVDQMELDIVDMPTQKIETLSQARKRTMEQETFDSVSEKYLFYFCNIWKPQFAQ